MLQLARPSATGTPGVKVSLASLPRGLGGSPLSPESCMSHEKDPLQCPVHTAPSGASQDGAHCPHPPGSSVGGHSPLPHLGLSPGSPGWEMQALCHTDNTGPGVPLRPAQNPGPEGSSGGRCPLPRPWSSAYRGGAWFGQAHWAQEETWEPSSRPREACEWVERLGSGPRPPRTPPAPCSDLCRGRPYNTSTPGGVCLPHSPLASFQTGPWPDGQPEGPCPAPPQVTRVSRKQTRSESPGFGSLRVCEGRPGPLGTARPGTVPAPAAPRAESGNTESS